MNQEHQKYIENTERTHRKKFGQFFTPEWVADFMVRWVLEKKNSSLFDPAFGLGAFLLSAKKRSPKIAFSGVEMDSRILQKSREIFSDEVALRHADYFQIWNETHSEIVCNPPYMRFQKFENREEILRQFQERLGVRFSGYTNIALAFLVKSVFELTPGGRLAYVLPLEFLNAGYGTAIKEYLLAHGTIYGFLQLACESEVFPDVTTTVGIFLFEKGISDVPTKFYVVHRPDQLKESLEPMSPVTTILRKNLDPTQKWTPFFERGRSLPSSEISWVPLSYYGAFHRGIATGANAFFTLRAEDVRRLGLRPEEVYPCITKSMQVRQSVFVPDDFEKLVPKGLPVFLLNAQGELSDAMKKYILSGEKQGVHQRFLTRCRRPWYANEKKPPASLWLGVFSRQGYRVVRNYTQTRNLTCYHGFYPHEGMESYVNALFLYLTSKAGRQVVTQNKRIYGKGLDKFEPGDLNQSLVPPETFLKTFSDGFIAEEMAHIAQYGTLSVDGERAFESLVVNGLD